MFITAQSACFEEHFTQMMPDDTQRLSPSCSSNTSPARHMTSGIHQTAHRGITVMAHLLCCTLLTSSRQSKSNPLGLSAGGWKAGHAFTAYLSLRNCWAARSLHTSDTILTSPKAKATHLNGVQVAEQQDMLSCIFVMAQLSCCKQLHPRKQQQQPT